MNREFTFREEIFLVVKFPGKKKELLELDDILSLSLSPTSGSYFFYFAIQTSTLNTFICVCHPLSLLEHALGHDAVYQGDSAYMNITFPRFQRLLARVHKSCFKSTLMSGKVNDEPFPLGTMCELAAL